jgi:alpha-tubulin suppressor-like RCC1 family protein
VPSKVENGTGRSEDDARTDFYVWGTDKHGQLGQNVSKKLFVAPRQCFFTGAERVRKVSCGDSHSAILTEEGLLYTFGSNQGGKLGIKDVNSTSVKAPTLVEDLVFGFDMSGRQINRI